MKSENLPIKFIFILKSINLSNLKDGFFFFLKMDSKNNHLPTLLKNHDFLKKIHDSITWKMVNEIMHSFQIHISLCCIKRLHSLTSLPIPSEKQNYWEVVKLVRCKLSIVTVA